ncbi:2-hydroxyacyl-CoA dehydratase subunit D [Clostridium beijerinckii]|uniref:Benzoyl-CoA reductase/2-hydroxyglutaryl-CoA dehydratase subunit BcrC/BadD/HgdB n=2 Tax=Clostridium beijerinckii TaxID=1520 RepID=A0A9Q5GKB7_CLOBE|nr:2-hydroxyacyl-CoA dehydratase family protein [Clostridium beijerinckii]AQS04686.1 R-phenyllactate dehydratase beta subunit [Clostridium beijerinckii]MBA2886865.1 benzoyl-CoA reductase/2-hydroxyglutaryl-CoA dehydratase subunit BcrC/BadD/HgdB [Clostridium beijerinckii]MBA2901881.1 benzoyl-CoA reductase/2-hydroxyglutaryl-CoA dehydratase subunit BcrC/BadD/HgdB [Clostridium beijerinckii]MBA2911580.1 benzoyl-CoA reductase/2-hydroxyglutaryl-CoA dehydratase subunit BcrC/BadD/HgdB [Clostridium beijer
MATLDELLLKFKDIAANPDKQLKSYLESGKKVVACAPVYTPEEIIHSMEFIPMGVWGADIEIKESKQYFPAFICSIMQSILELGITGAYKGVSAIVIPSLCDSLKTLGQNWKYAVKDIPFIPMTYPQNRNNKNGMEFTKVGYERVIKDLEDATGAVFSEEALQKSIEIYNAHNEAMRKVSNLLIDYPQITASQRSDIFKSAYFMLKEDHTKLLNEFMNELKKTSQVENKKIKIITSGILADNKNLLKILDDNNMQIVGDDIAHESRQYRVDTRVTSASLDALSEKFGKMDNCSLLYDVDKKRANYIVDLAKRTGGQGVIIFMTKFCDPEEFDYVFVKRALDTAQIPSTLVEVDRQIVNYEQAKTIIETFKEMIE